MKEKAALEAGDAERGLRLDRFLRKRFRKLPRSLLQKLLRTGDVTVNGERASGGRRLEPGDRIEVLADIESFALPRDHLLREAERRRASPWFEKHFRLLHEDDALIVLDKPSGIVVHPSKHHWRGDSLLDLLRAHGPEAFAPESEFRPAFVHRLDRGTSGVIVAAKTRDAARAMEGAFQRGEVRKTYRALIAGILTRDDGTIDLEIERRRKPSGVTRYTARTEQRNPASRRERPYEARSERASLRARSRFRVLERFRRATLLEVATETGRTHQIRVHLAALGHPILGDGDYGDRRRNRAYRIRYGLDRLFLHAAEIDFPHPISGERVSFRAPLPPELARVQEALAAPGDASR